MHERIHNSFALGNVARDGYWRTSKGHDQLAAIRAMYSPKDIGIVASHHPVHDPDPWLSNRANKTGVKKVLGFLNRIGIPSPVHTLLNRRDVAKCIRSLSGDNSPCFVLSGHTHETFPEIDKLPTSSPVFEHKPLGDESLQLTVGTVSKLPPEGDEPENWHCWQLLDFFHDEPTSRLLLERTVFVRKNFSGDFEPAVNGDLEETTEALWFDLPQ